MELVHIILAIITSITGIVPLVLLYISTRKLIHRDLFFMFFIAIIFLFIFSIFHLVREYFDLVRIFGIKSHYFEYGLLIAANIGFILGSIRVLKLVKDYSFKS